MSITKPSVIFKDSVDKIRDTVARPSLDTFFEVEFAFGKWQTWLTSKTPIGLKRTQARGFQHKMSLLCTQAELPGTSFVESTAIGHRQGIQESFPNLRNFPPLNLVFYVDADHVILEVLESWMSYINPIFDPDGGVDNNFTRFNYPDDYKETIRLTKFERDSIIEDSRNATYKSELTGYEFRNVWPRNMTSMRVAYGDSNVLRCSVQFAYDRFFTAYTKKGEHRQFAVQTPVGTVDSKEISATQALVNRDNKIYGNTVPANSFSMSKKNLKTTGQLVRADNAQYGNSFPAGAF